MVLKNEASNAKATLLLAHGAGAPMDSPALNAITNALVAENLSVLRFEFSYMAARRSSAVRKPPPRADLLVPEYLSAIEAVQGARPLIIGGKSMGGRVASMVADASFASGHISGVLCLGYPFHPVGKPDQLRTAHLAAMKTPTLIVQGTRDPFGSRQEVASCVLSNAVDLIWLEDGDHDFKPRKKISGLSVSDHLRTMAAAVSSWVDHAIGRR